MEITEQGVMMVAYAIAFVWIVVVVARSNVGRTPTWNPTGLRVLFGCLFAMLFAPVVSTCTVYLPWTIFKHVLGIT
jgi:hypothetical protein